MIFNIYLFCLAVGVIYTIITTLMHGVVSVADIGADADFDLDADLDIDADFDVDGDGIDIDIGHSSLFLPIKPFTIMIFLTVFGGSGIILTQFLWSYITLPIALVMAYLASFLSYKLIYLKLVRVQTIAKRADAAIGNEAKVIERIPEGGIGRISYKVDGNILSGAAKELHSYTGGFPKDTKVFIHEIKDNIYYVADYPLIYSNLDKGEMLNG